MSVALDENTVSIPLWPVNGVPTRSTGQILQATLTGKETPRFTLTFFDPQNPTTLYACTSSSLVYAFFLNKNVVRLFIALECAITAMTCFSCSGSSLFVCATGDNSLVWVDCTSGRIVKRMKTPHQHAVNMIRLSHVIGGHRSIVTASRESLAVWDVARMACRMCSNGKSTKEKREFLSIHTGRQSLLTVERFGRVTMWEPSTLSPSKSIMLAMQPRASAFCQKCLAIGGPGPLVGLLEVEGLTPIGCVQLSTAPVATRSLFIINDTLLACELTSGTVVFVVIGNYTVSFSLDAPHTGAVPRKMTSFSLSGPSFAAFAQGEKLTIFHLPTARQHYVHRERLGGGYSDSTLPARLHSFVQGKSNAYREGASRTSKKCARDENPGSDVELPRPNLRPADKDVNKWVKVKALPAGVQDEVKSTKGSAGGRVEPLERTGKDRKVEKGIGPRPKGGVELSLRPSLDEESRKANMNHLQQLLLRYGLFPDTYRAVTWRFLLQLPDKRFTASQYAQLASKGTHPSAHILMKPFRLANDGVQTSMEKALSVLVWHVPMFAAIHFLPMVVYPFLHPFEGDVQSVVEVVLVFLSNWGKEFFQFYPQQPVALTTLLDRLLRAEDAELHRHLSMSGVLVEEWGWEPLRSIYSDTVKPAEWLQVLDHTFFNEPLWFFLFHIRWMISIRSDIMKFRDQREIMNSILTTHDVDVNRIIGETYRLQARCPRGELTNPYSKLETLANYAYPTLWKYNEENVERKLNDMKLLQEQIERSKASSQEIAKICDQLAQADVLEEVYVRKQQAEAAARVSAKADSWKGEVAREMERQYTRDMEKMLRLRQMRQQIEQSGRLEVLNEELECANIQVDHLHEIRQREATHWTLADQLSEQELLHLEEAARNRLKGAKKAVESGTVGAERSPVTDGGEFGAVKSRMTTAAPDVVSVVRPLSASPGEQQLTYDLGNPMNVYRALQNSAAREMVGRRIPSETGGKRVQRSYDDTHVAEVVSTVGATFQRQHGDHLIAAFGKASDSRSERGAALYDNLLPLGASPSETQTLCSSDLNRHTTEHRQTSESYEPSSAATVLLRPQDPGAYRLQRWSR